MNFHYRVDTKPDEKKDGLMSIVLDIKWNGRSTKKMLSFCRINQECIDIFVELVTELSSEDALRVHPSRKRASLLNNRKQKLG